MTLPPFTVVPSSSAVNAGRAPARTVGTFLPASPLSAGERLPDLERALLPSRLDSGSHLASIAREIARDRDSSRVDELGEDGA